MNDIHLSALLLLLCQQVRENKPTSGCTADLFYESFALSCLLLSHVRIYSDCKGIMKGKIVRITYLKSFNYLEKENIME